MPSDSTPVTIQTSATEARISGRSQFSRAQSAAGSIAPARFALFERHDRARCGPEQRHEAAGSRGVAALEHASGSGSSGMPGRRRRGTTW
jgi:hypothetical protein